MDNNLTLLLLSKKEVEILTMCGYKELAELNNQVVDLEDVYEVKRVLGSIHSRNRIDVRFTKSELNALRRAGREDYAYLNGKTVGEDLYYTVMEFIDDLKKNSSSLEC